jgi:hypothetical protein
MNYIPLFIGLTCGSDFADMSVVIFSDVSFNQIQGTLPDNVKNMKSLITM